MTMYADDCCVWTAQGNPEVLKARLEVLLDRMIQYALKNSQSLNSAKTQVMWVGPGSQPNIRIGSALVPLQQELLLLGLSFDHRLSVSPFRLCMLEKTVKSLSALTSRLLTHLPRGQLVQQVVAALVRGKFCYSCILLPVRLKPEDPTCQLRQSIQTSINNMAIALWIRTSLPQASPP